MVEKVTAFRFSNRFRKEYQKLPEEIQNAFDEKLVLFLKNPSHPSLRVKKIQGTRDRREGSVTMKYRFTFELSNNVAFFRTIGTHDILKR